LEADSELLDTIKAKEQLKGMRITWDKIHVLEAYGAQPANPR